MSIDSTPRTITLPLDEWEDITRDMRLMAVAGYLGVSGRAVPATVYEKQQLLLRMGRWADEIGRQQ